MSYIIAEVGSNWQTLEHIMGSITLAKACGADAVKFQLFTPYDLYGQGIWPQFKPGINPWLDPHWLPRMKIKCDAVGIDLMCSAFSVEGIKRVDPYVKAHKIASAELCHPLMLEAVAKIGKPIFASCGAHTPADIHGAVCLLKGINPDLDLTLMYCISAYPTYRSNRNAMRTFGAQFSNLAKIGFSDHSKEIFIQDWWCFNNLSAIEKHVNFASVMSPDSPHSISTEDFKDYVDALRESPPKWNGPTPEERSMIVKHKRRLILTQSLIPGDVLKLGENFGIYRSLKEDLRGAHPFTYERFEGKVVNSYLTAGDGLSEQDIDSSGEQQEMAKRTTKVLAKKAASKTNKTKTKKKTSGKTAASKKSC